MYIQRFKVLDMMAHAVTLAFRQLRQKNLLFKTIFDYMVSLSST